MSRREKLVYLAVGGFLLSFILAGVILRSVLRADVDDALAAVPEGTVVLKIDLGAAWDRHVDASEGSPAPVFAILPEDIERGDVSLSIDGWVNEDERYMAVRFEGYWDEADGYPMILREDALTVPRRVEYLEDRPFITEVQAVGDIDDAGVVTFVLGPQPED